MIDQVITTFSYDGYQLYGHRMIETWLQYWPSNYHLTVYTESYELDEKNERIKNINLLNCSPELTTFKLRSQQLLDQATDSKQIKRIQKTIKWCHKLYAIKHALNTPSNYLLYLDGDTYTTSAIKKNLIKNLVIDDLFAVHFESLKGTLHFESGLIAFNQLHPMMEIFKSQITSGYDSLDIYNMPKTWDGFWLAHLYQTLNLPVRNLAENAIGVFCNPLIRGKIIHDIGKRKYVNAGYNESTGRKNNIEGVSNGAI